MENVIIAAVLVVIVGLASLYVYKAKKSGKKCIGCPSGNLCNGNCKDGNSACNCSCSEHK